MISFQKCSDLSPILELKADYLTSLIAPMDGMWDSGFTLPAPHWKIFHDGILAGYYAANDEGGVLQFYLLPAHRKFGRAIWEKIQLQDGLTHAVVSTIDPFFLSLCLETQKGITVHTNMYEHRWDVIPEHADSSDLVFRPLKPDELERTIEFQQACLSDEHDLREWLRGYSSNLINRGETWVLARGDEWIGMGERRKSDSQNGVTDVGMMVHPDKRGKGWAVYILTLMTTSCVADGRRVICSTTIENIGAQKAIERAGFGSDHRILNVTF